MTASTQKKKMLLTGVSGLLGSNIAYCLRDNYDICGVYNTHRVDLSGIQTKKADLTSSEEVGVLIKDFQPDIIVHCAAQADVDRCEQSPQEAESKNILGTQNVVNNLNGDNTKLIFISTDLVYDGVKKGSYSEEDPINPQNCYSATKRKAEEVVLTRKSAVILRTNFFGWNVQDKFNLGEWAINELTQKKKINGFTDSIFSGIYTFEFAKILDLIVQKNLSGIYNCASSTSISKYEFVNEIANRLGLDKNLINPSSLDDFGFPAKRSRNLSLNTSKLTHDLSADIPPISYSIERFIEDYKNGIPQQIKSNSLLKNVYPSALDIISYGRQSIDEEDIAAVVEVLKSKSVTQGPKVNEFERALCQETQADLAVATNSGTSSLHIACLAAGIGPGDEVITSPNTFVASANCVVYCQGKPVFADIDPQSYNILPQEIEKKINERTKAIIPVHFAGQSCDMIIIQNIVKASEKKFGHKIYIIEDACHALGSRYKKTLVGSGAYSDMTVMSFHPVKHITTGEGGCVLTNDKELWRKLSYFRSHGITSDPDEFVNRENAFEKNSGIDEEPVRNQWYYEQNCLGYNYRITEIQCALGISQLKKLGAFRQRRLEIVNQYNRAFEGFEWLTVPSEDKLCDSNFHLYVLQIDFEKIGITRAKVMAELRKKGILSQVHYIPVHTQPFYQRNFGTHWGDCPNAEQYYKGCLSIPLFPALSEKDVQDVINSVRGLVQG